MRLTRWSWYLMVSMIAVVFAESLSWSTPIIMANAFVLIFYGLHYVLYVDFLAQKDAITLRALAVGGLLLGITSESLLTKVIWNPPREAGDETLRILGLGIFEVGFIVGVWHVWISSAIPIGLTISFMGPSGIFNKAQIRRILKWLPLAVFFSASFAGYDPITLLVTILVNVLSIFVTIVWFRRRHRKQPLLQVSQLILTRWERRLMWLGIVGLYALGLVAFRPEAYPEIGPFILGMILVVGSFWLLWRVRLDDQHRTPHREDIQFSYRGFFKYLVYFTVTSLILGTLAIISVPVSLIVAMLGAFFTVPIGNGYLVRMAWRLFHKRESDETINHVAKKTELSPLLID